jgi:glycosyltransferase involved in cell wall biosynthesis
MTNANSASVIISTYNGAGRIGNLLNALAKQSHMNFEIVVVIDGSTDNTAEVVAAHNEAFKSIKTIIQGNKGRAAVKNRGVKEASGDVVIFYDDDMVPETNSVQKHIAFHEKFSGILSGNPIEDEDISRTDVQNYKAALTKIWTAKYDGLTLLSFSNLFFSAANCSVRKEVFETLHGFDERLNDAEDFDFAYRAMESGVLVYFDKSNRAYHQESITCLSYINRLRQYSKAHQKLSELHPDRKSKSASETSMLKKIIYRIFSFLFWVKLIDTGFFVPILPRKIRHKLYSLVIQSLAIEYPATKL